MSGPTTSSSAGAAPRRWPTGCTCNPDTPASSSTAARSTLINWADASSDTGGIRQHHGHLQADWLEVVSEREHHHAVEQLRASGWPGFPLDDGHFLTAWRAEPHPYHRLDRLPMSSYVRWRGPDDATRRLHLQPGHTGLLITADEAHAVIDWTDAPEVLQYNGRLDPDWMD
ncbi:hypothetical protein [Kineococcus aurantiacus]|uniref:Uncharacterized protein n=1 Tax=Kineococcus aurantiacus TaxID=37633 RepID=A0A7Y9J0Z4_9ACTN|nr:hypothetical protein [Kineococcus aurantiacus]NYD22598.1 hypothetical protein [Kineococcus aurantiacus]